MFWNKSQPSGENALCVNPLRFTPRSYLVAARTDTSFNKGLGKVTLTGKYESKKDSFTVNLAYIADVNNTFFGAYSVTDEKLASFGFESGFHMGKARSTVDVSYLPPLDAAACKLSVRQGKIKLSATTTVTSVRSGGDGRQHTESFELDSQLSAKESLSMSFNAKSKATTLKLSRRLDPKNRVEAQYVYNKASDQFATLSYTHLYSKMHTFLTDINYGAKKISIEWDCSTANGPWTLTSSFPFNASPLSGDWSVKRRFEF